MQVSADGAQRCRVPSGCVSPFAGSNAQVSSRLGGFLQRRLAVRSSALTIGSWRLTVSRLGARLPRGKDFVGSGLRIITVYQRHIKAIRSSFSSLPHASSRSKAPPAVSSSIRCAARTFARNDCVFAHRSVAAECRSRRARNIRLPRQPATFRFTVPSGWCLPAGRSAVFCRTD